MQSVKQTISAPCTAPQGVLARHRPSRRPTTAVTSLQQPFKVQRLFSSNSTACRPRRHALRLTCAAATKEEEEVYTREEQLAPCKVRLHITIPKKTVEGCYKEYMDTYRKQVAVPGFRKGKAPDASVLAEIGGKERFNNTVIAGLLEIAMKKGLKAYDSRIIEDSEAVDQDINQLGVAFDPKGDFNFSVTFDTMPELKWKSSYKDLQVKVEAVGDDDSDSKAVDERLEALRKDRASMKVVADRPMQMGDMAVIDIDLTNPEGGGSLVGGAREGFRLESSTSDQTFIPGVAGGLVGTRVGECRTFPLTLPQDFRPANLSGQNVVVVAALKELFEPDLPELSDTWAESVEPGCGGLEGLRAKLMEEQRKRTDANTHKAIEDALLEAVSDIVDCPVPEALIIKLGQQEYQAKLEEAISSGQLSYEVVQQLATEQLVMEFIEKERGKLERLQRGVMGIQRIIEDEKIQATMEEIQPEMEAALAGFKTFEQEFDGNKLREQVQQQIEARKAVDWLLANAKIEVLPFSGGSK